MSEQTVDGQSGGSADSASLIAGGACVFTGVLSLHAVDGQQTDPSARADYGDFRAVLTNRLTV